MNRPWTHVVPAAMTATWLAVIAAGFAAWEVSDAAPADLPTARPAPHPSQREGWELSLFAHPHCPCTRAALVELGEVLSSARRRVTVRVLFVRPVGAAEGWEFTDSWTRAEAIPGVEVHVDPEGAEARRVGAATSGTAVLTDPAGRVVFRGGITRARGRSGESTGRTTILAMLGGDIREGATAPVFGCPLLTPDGTEGGE